MNKFWKIALCLVFAVSVSACNDDSSDDGKKGSTTGDVSGSGNESGVPENGSGSGSGSGSESGSGSSDKPVVGSACDYYTYSESCIDGNAYYCGEGNTIESVSCSGSSSCIEIANGYGEGINYAGCLSKEDQCSKLGDKTVLCADELYESYTFEAVLGVLLRAGYKNEGDEFYSIKLSSFV